MITTRLSALALLLLLALAPAVQAGGKKPPPVEVSFHLQGDASDGAKWVFPQETAGKELYFRKTPDITHKDIVAFRPFPSDDDKTFGIIFQLRDIAAKRLRNLCNANRDRYLLAMVNGQVRDAVLIDRAPTDNYIIIWQRIGNKEIKAADMLMPRIGEDPKVWKENLKKKK